MFIAAYRHQAFPAGCAPVRVQFLEAPAALVGTWLRDPGYRDATIERAAGGEPAG